MKGGEPMKQVQVHPERCLGCMQCMLACATAHSRTKNLFTAAGENPLPKPRLHVGAGCHDEGFPNRCRHCDPAPCLLACLPGAIFRDPDSGTVLVDPDLCINCASCAMACPFGVLRYHQDWAAPAAKIVAQKCDNCLERQHEGLIPACVEVCKTGALTFEESDEALRRKTREVARSISAGMEEQPVVPSGVQLLHQVKKQRFEMQCR
jgi:carbon-monoxide dehydrogenase iron sulfur subunit